MKDVEKKIVLIESDMSELNLGLSGEDRERIKDTEVIFHCAASVRFNDTLRLILNINVRGTRDLLLLARDMPNLKVRCSFYTKRMDSRTLPSMVLKEFIYYMYWFYSKIYLYITIYFRFSLIYQRHFRIAFVERSKRNFTIHRYRQKT